MIRRQFKDIDPDEIFLDSENIPEHDNAQFDGRIDKPINKSLGLVISIVFIFIICIFTGRLWFLQVKNGEAYTERSLKNYLRHTPLFAARGVIFDRNKNELAWNSPSEDQSLLIRKYTELSGLAHVLGYVQYPSKDSSGFYYREDFIGVDGVEKAFNERLKGKNGLRILEVDALGKISRENIIRNQEEGENIELSIDSKLQNHIYKEIEALSKKVGFSGGAGVIMDIENGEILALTNYPEYSSEIMSLAKDKMTINSYLNDKNTPFLNRVVHGLYTPGSIVKPIVALGALNESIIDPEKEILSTGSISIQNEYDPKIQTIFRDWKAHGYVDMRHAISVSSDVYFYAIGGGYKDQIGLGIDKIDEYAKMFGLSEKISTPFFTSGPSGVIPTPEWKAKVFDGEGWRLGNTYHTAIGQYGFQVTPLQMVRAISTIARKGTMIEPVILKGEIGKQIKTLEIPEENFNIVIEGMKLAASEGTSAALNVPFVKVVAKSGTAELGVSKQLVNSWIVGFFPADKPKYAFAVVMEKGPRDNLIGATSVFRAVLDWMNVNTPEYFNI